MGRQHLLAVPATAGRGGGELRGLFTLLLRGAAAVGNFSFIGVVWKLFVWGGGDRK